MALKAIAPSAAGANAPGAIEDEYQKLTQREHILKRPDTYVGSVEAETRKEWVMVEAAGRMEQRDLTVAPALYKIFDEILVNAADNKQRDASMDAIKVEIDREGGRISVWNNGRGIPVEEHKEHKCYVPELIFGARRARRARRARPPAAPPPTRARRRAAQATCSPGATSRTTRRR
jgi:DNA topoisomerase-2